MLRYILLCDGACEPNPGQMAIGVKIKSRIDKNKNTDRVIKTLSQVVGEGTNNQAEYIAVLKGLEAVKEMFINCGDIPELREIYAYTDSQLVANQVNGSFKINDGTMGDLCGQIHEIRDFFDRARIPVTVQWLKSARTKAAHNLAMQALYGKDYYAFAYQQNVIDLAKRGVLMVPLSAFRRKEWSKLTISECLVLDLIERRKMSIPEVAKELDRKYNTIRTQLLRARVKVGKRGKQEGIDYSED